MNCPGCNATVDAGHLFCTRCGAKLGVTCPRCGQPASEEQLFCGLCGARLYEEVTPTLTEATRDLEQERLSRMIERLPKRLARKMTGISSTLKGERRQVTVAFADISGFTALSEELDPEEVSEILNGCFSALSDVIYRYEGYIDKFIGDCIMGLFGAPIAHENDAELAVGCALDMMKRMEDYNASIAHRLKKPLSLHIGINTGRVVATNIGPDCRMQYTVIGDTVNIAARLKDQARSGEILISEHTFNQLRDSFSLQEQGLIEVRGRRKPVRVFRVLGKRRRPRRPRQHGMLSAPMIGRDREFERLKECFLKLKKGQGQVITVVSEAGIGKSRMWYELSYYMKESGIAKYEGECVIYGQSIAYSAFIDLLKNMLDISEGDLELAISAKIFETIPALVGEKKDAVSDSTRRSMAYVSSLLGVRAEGEADERLRYMDPAQAREETFRGLRDFFCRLAQRIPLALIFENLHWADNASLDLITYLMKPATDYPLMLFCIYRPSEHSGCWKLGYAARRICPDIFTEMVFKRLSSKESDTLVKSLLGTENIPAEIMRKIRRKAEGNPFYIEEVIRSLIEKKIIQQSNEGWNISGAIDEVSIPDTVEGIVMARIDQLGGPEKLVLQCASVVGRSFTREILCHLTENTVNMEVCLRNLLDAGLIERGRQYPEPEYVFKNILTQEVIYENLLLKRKKELHQRAAEYVEKLCTERIEKYSELLAYHYSRASVFDKASAFLIKAGQRARSLFANDEAIRYFAEALRILQGEGYPKPDELASAHEGLGDVHELIGNYDEAIGQFDKVIELNLEPLTTARAARKIGRIYEKLGNLDRALACYQDAFDALKGAGDTVELARVCMNVGWIHNRLAEYDKAIELCTRALNILEGTECVADIARAHNNLAVIYEYSGEWEKAHLHSDKSIEIAQSIGDDQRLGDYYAGAGLLAWKEGKLEEAIACQHKSMELMDKTGNTYGKAGVLLNIGTIYTDLNEPEKAIQSLEEALAIHRRLKAEGKLCKNHRALARGHLLAGNYRQARWHCREALKIAEKVPYEVDAGVAHQILAEIAMAMNDDPEPHFKEAAERISRRKRNYELSQVLMSYGQWKIKSGNKAEGEELMEQARALMAS